MTPLERVSVAALSAICLLSGGCRGGQVKNAEKTINADKRVEMTTKAEGDQKPLFRAALKFKNTDGSDAENVPLQSNVEDLKKAFRIKTSSKKTATPFFVATASRSETGDAVAEASHDILLLFDVSGSMRERDIPPDRFTAAKTAALDLVNGLPANYRVAVAPFESRKVLEQIRKAQFHSREQAIADINSLPVPDFRGNTALYDAIDKSLDVLKQRKDEGQSQDQSLIVLTDGKNDVGRPGDDPGLLGDNDYPKLLGKLRSFNTRTFTIGLGKPNRGGKNDLAFEETKLREIASLQGETRYFQAEDLQQLKSNFVAVQKSVKNTVLISFCTDDNNLYDLRSLKFEISYTSAKGQVYRGEIPWICRNSITGCVPSRAGALNPRTEEYTALEKSGCNKEGRGPWQQILLLFGQLTIFSGGIAAFWMFVPSLIWPGIPTPQLSFRRKSKSALPGPAPRESQNRSNRSGPRQRFEETRIYNEASRREGLRGE
jgi:Mg-chelatase subunit ChlD